MKRFRQPRGSVAILGLALTVTVALSGCTSAVNRGNAGADPTAEPVRGGTITVIQNADPMPGVTAAGRAGNTAWMANVFEPLTRTDPGTGEPYGVVADSWELADDLLSIAVTLRDDVTFHSGRALTAEDVKFNYDKVADPAFGSRFLSAVSTWKGIDVVSDTELVINFATPTSNIFDIFEGVFLTDQDTFAGLADGSSVIGTGPYTFSDWEPGASFTLTRYDDYRDPDVAYLDSIEFAIIADATAVVSALRSDRGQIGLGLGSADVAGFASDPNFTVEAAGGTIFTLGMDVTVPPFDNKEVRQAVGYAIDRERINDQVFAGLGTPTDLWWGTETPGYTSELADHYTYDPEKAKSMIEDAGATGAELPIMVAALPFVQSVYEVLQNNLEEVGINAVAVPVSLTEFDAQQSAGTMGTGFINFHGQVGLSSATLIGTLPAIRKGNPSKFFPDEYVSLREDLLAAPADETAAAVEALSEYMLDEAFTQVFLQSPNQNVIASSVRGVTFSGQGYFLLADASTTE
jgi:peptide/nickel transport system substrate-binding protein